MTNKTSYVITLFFMLFGMAWACGPEFDEDSDLEMSLHFDPAVSTAFNPRHVLQALGIAENDWQVEEKIDVLAQINAISSAAGRAVEFVETGGEYSGSSILDRCPLVNNRELIKMLDEVKYSKLIIIGRSGGSLRARFNKWDTIPEGKSDGKRMYTEWLDEVVRNVIWMCDVKPEYYPQLQRRQNVQEYVAPRDNELFTQLREHPQLHHYASLVEALVLFHEGDYDSARKLALQVATDSKDAREIEVAIAIGKLKPAMGDSRQRYVIDNLSYGRFGWGTCASNTPDNALALIRSAAADRSLSEDAYRTLVGWRVALLADCTGAKAPAVASEGTEKTNAHLLYMNALQQFYGGNYEQAAKVFLQIAQRGKGWEAETGAYLVARSRLLAAQKDWVPYREPLPGKIKQLSAAYDGFISYLEQYPAGAYVTSARGMLRRVDYLRGNKEAYRKLLDEAFDAALRRMSHKEALGEQDKERVASLLNEYNIYAEGDEVNSVDRLQAGLSRLDLSANSDLVALSSELDYLKAAIKAYEDKDINFFENNRKRTSQLAVYHGILAARAMERERRYDEANEVWQRIKPLLEHPTDAELAIAANIMRSGTLIDLLNSHYELRDMIIVGYLSAQCGADDGYKLLDEDLSGRMRALVLHDLAIRQLTTGNINKLQALFDKYDDKAMGELASIRTAVRMVATGSNPGKGNMNIGYFLARHGVPESYSSVHTHYAENATGKCIQTDGHEGSYSYFLKALEQYEESSSEDEAKTLHFLVMCDKVGAGGLACWGDGERQPGKFWFEKLHSEYPKSTWSKKTPYYYD